MPLFGLNPSPFSNREGYKEFLEMPLILNMRFVGTLALVIIATCAHGQEKYIQQSSVWVRYYLQARLADKFTLHYNLDERVLTNPTRQFQVFTHLNLNYQAKPWIEFAVGGNFNWTNSTKNQSLKVPEWRPWQEVSLIKSLPHNWQLQFRYRIDERFVHNNDKVVLTEGYHYNTRHRFRPQLSYTFKTANDKQIVLRISDEYMFNTGDFKDRFDQNRAYVSIQYPLNKKWPVEVGYMNQVQSRSNDDGFYERHNIRITFYHKVDWRKKEPAK